MQENEDKSTTGFEMEDHFVSIQNEDHDHTNTSVHIEDNADGKQKGQKANHKADIFMWCPDSHLDQEDRHVLIHNKWLSDKHIYAAQILLKKQFADIGGLQPPTLS